VPQVKNGGITEAYNEAYRSASQERKIREDNLGERLPGSDGEQAAEADAIALGKAKIGEAQRRK
jgi:hypothetical protein